MTKSLIAIILLLSIVLIVFPLPASAFSFVPCGRSDQQPPPGAVMFDDYDPNDYLDAQCQLGHMFILITRIINYLITVAAMVAMYFVLLSGFNLITSMGNPDKVTEGKEGISHALVGFGMIILAFVFVNLLVNGIFGSGDPTERKWWELGCIYDITDTSSGCPQDTIFMPIMRGQEFHSPRTITKEELIDHLTKVSGDVQSLAGQIKNNSSISLANAHASRNVDNATAKQNIEQLAAGQQALRSCYEPAPCGSTAVDRRVLAAMLALAEKYRFSVSEIAGGAHSDGSSHYSGRAFDVNYIGGWHVDASHPSFREFMSDCREIGATKVLGPGDKWHDRHIHCGW